MLIALVLGPGGAAYGAPARQAKEPAQQPTEEKNAVRVTASPQMFATLCAVYAAGYPVIPENVPPQLKDLTGKLAALQGPAVTALRTFYQDHRLPSDADTLARYVSFAMVAGPPPSFSFVVPREGLPPDVRALDGFQKLLVNFYTEEHVDRFWSQVESLYDADAFRLRGPVSQVVAVAAGYARRMNRFEGGRTFTVYVDPLIGPATNFRIYSELYEIAVNPSSPAMMTDIRHAFLHFLLDPLPFNNLGLIESKQDLLDNFVRAPRLPNDYKQDFVAFTDECFIRAVELHLQSLSPDQRNAVLDQNDRDGYVLVRPLFDGLTKYESSPDTLADYFPTLIKSIDVNEEAARERKIDFAPASAPPPAPAEARADRVVRWLEQGNRQIATQKPKDAAATFERVLQVDPKNTRAQYGLAVASALNGQGERAYQLFEQVVNSPAADPSVLAWSHVYLGRMSDLAGRRQNAIAQYQAVLGISGVPETAREAAERGIKQPYAPKETGHGAAPHR